MSEWLLIPAGFVAGLIDSIAGGSGLITVPSLVLVLGHGPHAIGTNKLAATVGVAISFLVYLRSGHFKARSAIPFAVTVGFSSLLGSLVSPQIPREIFPWLLLVTCPIVLAVVWKKNIWLKEHPPGTRRPHRNWIYGAGLVVGFYDGLWGPGGGTFMFLALVFLAKLPILESLAASKLANFISAIMSLGGYAVQGYVHYGTGAFLAGGMILGSFIGAHYASKNVDKVIRPALVVTTLLLLVKVLSELIKF